MRAILALLSQAAANAASTSEETSGPNGNVDNDKAEDKGPNSSLRPWSGAGSLAAARARGSSSLRMRASQQDLPSLAATGAAASELSEFMSSEFPGRSATSASAGGFSLMGAPELSPRMQLHR
jgi:hypothetical protein